MLTANDGEGPFRRGDFILRPIRPWTPGVHALLAALRANGFASAPLSAGHDETWEKVSFLTGIVGDLDASEQVRSIGALRSAAALLRRYHDCTALFVNAIAAQQRWQLPSRAPCEVICHGDFAPYNVVLNGGGATGIIDFETAHPGSRCWDLAYAIYRWAPLSVGIQVEGLDRLDAQIARACIFLDAYELPSIERQALPEMIIERLTVLLDFMEGEAARGVDRYRRNIEDGHDRIYRRDIAYLREHKAEILAGLAE